MGIWNFDYSTTTPGILKIFHICLGTINLILISETFVPELEGEQLLLLTISISLVISTIYLFAYFRCRDLVNSKENQQLEFLFHSVAAFMLILGGIDWMRTSNYSDICQSRCPALYLIVISKVIAFTNGTLYAIVAFLNTRRWKAIHPEEVSRLVSKEEGIPYAISVNI